MKFRPLHDRVLVRRLEEDEMTAGGIIIPDTAKEKPSQGKVVSVGAGARDESGKIQPLDVKKGDTILFGKWSGTECQGERNQTGSRVDHRAILRTFEFHIYWRVPIILGRARK